MMRDGVVLDEWLAPHAEAERPHVIFSISKSITGMLAGIAVGDGKLDPGAKVTDYVTVKRGSAYHAARVRDLLDMTVSLDFVENYLDTQGDFDRYRRAMLWNPERPGARQETMLEVLASLKPQSATRTATIYHYASPNTDMLGLVVEAAIGQRYHSYLADRLWAPMGARGAAHVTVDRVGAARAAGGVCVTARDLARFGQLVLDGGSDQRRARAHPAIMDRRHALERRPRGLAQGQRRACLSRRPLPLVLVQGRRRPRLVLRDRHPRPMDLDRPDQPHRAGQDVVTAGAERRRCDGARNGISWPGGARTLEKHALRSRAGAANATRRMQDRGKVPPWPTARCRPRLSSRLPATVPFVGPETQERTRGRAFRARIGANESGFGPSPRVARCDGAGGAARCGNIAIRTITTSRPHSPRISASRRPMSWSAKASTGCSA